jgi:integrase
MKLNALQVKALLPRDKLYKIGDGHGLFLDITPKGVKLWRIQYRHGGKQKTAALGKYPEITLKDARERLARFKVKLSEGIDPNAKLKTLADDVLTFRMMGQRWFYKNESTWVKTYAKIVQRRLDDDIYSQIGHMPISEITPVHVLGAVRRVEARGAISTGRRLNQMISAIFMFSVAEGVATHDPSQIIKAALTPLKPPKRRKALPGAAVSAFIAKVRKDDCQDVIKLAVELVAHTFVRTNEIRFAEWSDFDDLEGIRPMWLIPGSKMKMGRDHQVPLSDQAQEILMKLYKINSGSTWVFKTKRSPDNEPMSKSAMIECLYRCGYKDIASIHGLRATASTALNENEFNRDWIEMQLAHSDSSVRGVYNAALYVRQRRTMMQWWSDYIDPRTNAFDDILGER